MGIIMETLPIEGRSGRLGVAIATASAALYVAVLAACASSAFDKRWPVYAAMGATAFIAGCFPKLRWLSLFGFLAFWLVWMARELLDPMHDHSQKIFAGAFLCIFLLMTLARWQGSK